MAGIPGWLRWISPWVALGLAAALAYVLLRPAPDVVPQPAAPPAASGATAPAVRADAPAPTPAPQFVSYADAVDAAAPAVVNIFTERRVTVPNVAGLPPQLAQMFGDVWPDYRQRVERSLGSGIIWDVQGHVVTNFHVIAQATQIMVELKNGKSGPATLIGVDRDTDLAGL
jgi:serine protease DegS